MNQRFRTFAKRAAELGGSHWAFIGGTVAILAWLAAGPLLGFSKTWLLVAMAAAGIISFLVVFLVQSTKNAHAKAVHLKLNEIIRVLEPARDELIAVEDRTYEELTKLLAVYRELARKPHTPGDKDQLLAQALEPDEAAGTPTRDGATPGALGPPPSGMQDGLTMHSDAPS
ncbi:MAG TPA: low affinity iron permease family protein [Chloroflexia bacterium]|nr:low affinity iron permease family protein [Chloroflexia bacterium]